MKIHPTAIVDKGANIGADVEIGPYTIVGGEVSIGEQCRLESHVVIEGRVRIGASNHIGHGAIIGTPPQVVGFDSRIKSGVELGDGNVVREHCTIHRATDEGGSTALGNENFLMAGAHVGHNCRVGNKVIIANNCLLGGHVRVDDNAFLGGGSVFHQYMHVGRLAMVQGSSGFSKDIPPFLVAAEVNLVFGVNIVGLKRAGFSAEDRREIQNAFKLLYTSGLNVSQALEKAETENLGRVAREFFDFVAEAKKRGVCPFKGGEEGL